MNHTCNQIFKNLQPLGLRYKRDNDKGHKSGTDEILCKFRGEKDYFYLMKWIKAS